MIDINEIKRVIPHRYPFLMIDRILEINLGKNIVGIKTVSSNEPFFNGHFPDNPVMPGVLVVEAMGQLSTFLIAKTINTDRNESEAYLMSIESAKFRKMVIPGDVLNIYVVIEQNRGNVWKFSGIAKVDNQIVSEANFMAIVKKR